MQEPLVYLADLDLVVWLIVVGFTLVSQMVKAARNKPRRQPPVAQSQSAPVATARRPAVRPRPKRAQPPLKIPPPPPTEGAMDLQEMLEQLARRQQEPVFEETDFPTETVTETAMETDFPTEKRFEQPEPRQFEAPEPKREVRRVIVRQRPAPPPPAPPKAVVTDFPLRVAPALAPILESKADPYAESRRTKSELGLSALRTSLRVDMKQPASLRKAILLREILDPPLALRPASSTR